MVLYLAKVWLLSCPQQGKPDRGAVQKMQGSVSDTNQGGRLVVSGGVGGIPVDIVPGGRVAEKTSHSSVKDSQRRDVSAIRSSQPTSEPSRKQQSQQQQQQQRKITIHDQTPTKTEVIAIADNNAHSSVVNCVVGGCDTTAKDVDVDEAKTRLHIKNDNSLQQFKDDITVQHAPSVTHCSTPVAAVAASKDESHTQSDRSKRCEVTASPSHGRPPPSATLADTESLTSPIPTSSLPSSVVTTPSKTAFSNHSFDSSSSSSNIVPPSMAGVANQFVYDVTMTATKTSTPDSTTPDFPLPPSPPPAFGPALSLDSPIPLPPPPPTPPAEEKTPNHVTAPPAEGVFNNVGNEKISNMSSKRGEPVGVVNGNGVQRCLEAGTGGVDDIVSIASSGSFATVSSAGSGGGAAVSRGKESEGHWGAVGAAGPGGPTGGQQQTGEDDLVRDTRSDLLSAIREGS